MLFLKQILDEWILTDVGKYKVIKDVEANGLCNKIEGCSWMESKDICTMEEGGYLAQISTEKENGRILEVLTELKFVEKGFNFYIGLQKKNDEHFWSSDLKKVGYANFKQGKILKSILIVK